MGLFNTMNTAVSGMTAQATALGTIGDNIANANTTGYKEASTQFSTQLGLTASTVYNSGGVTPAVRYAISDQGTLQTTTSSTDLAINGAGFFVVQNKAGQQALTRAGSFVPDAAGNLVNAAGYYLLGYPSSNAALGAPMQIVNIASPELNASASKTGILSLNLPSNAAVATGNLPSTNTAPVTYTDKSSLTTYDNLGNAVNLDIYLTKTAPNTWEATVYNNADATAGGFPYANPPLDVETLNFDPTNGQIAPSTTSKLTIPVPNGNTVSVDLSHTTQLAAAFNVQNSTADGNAPTKLTGVAVDSDGTLKAVYASGAKVSRYSIPLANVMSPDNLTPIAGNVYDTSATSGPITLGFPQTPGLGTIAANSLEQSTVDIATQLTNMISAQRSYEANTKVLQTSSDLLQLINNIKA